MGRTECRPGARSGCGSERMIASCNRSRLVKNTSIMSLWSGRSGYSLGSTNWSCAEGCDDEHLAVTRNAGAHLQLRDHAIQCDGPTEEHLVEELAGIIWRKHRLRMAEAAVYREKLRHDATGYQTPDHLVGAALLPLTGSADG